MDEASARRVVYVQAYDAAETPLWTREDGQWASRLASQTTPADANAERWLAERARHALERLAPRDAALRRVLARSPWRWRWLVGIALLAGVAGLGTDLVGRRAYIDLLAAPVWAVVVWNLVVYLALALVALRPRAPRRRGLRGWLVASWQRAAGAEPLREASRRWSELTVPLTTQRAAAVLHVAAAAFAAGLIAGLYLRGLVFDYRVGWQSTFLDAATVHGVLGVLLAPASALTGIALPDATAIDAMRITPQMPDAGASAAPWIHLYAATLGLAVIAPRLLLALAALLRAWIGSRRVTVPIEQLPGLHAARRRHRGEVARVRVQPYAAPPAAQAALGLRAILARVYGEAVDLAIAETTPVGDEESALARLAGDASGDALRIALVDLGATPEVEAHGRFVRTLRAAQPAAPLLLLVDEAGFVRRFGTLPSRVEERRDAWRALARELGVALVITDLAAPDLAQAEVALNDALAA